MNLVMVGRFRDAATAETVIGIIEKLTSALRSEETAGRLTIGEPRDRYSDEVMSLLLDLRIHNLGPAELEQFLYEVTVRRDGDKVVIKTDEIEVQALMKVLLTNGARVQVYSAHEHSDTDDGSRP